jgi:hypothetical protein
MADPDPRLFYGNDATPSAKPSDDARSPSQEVVDLFYPKPSTPPEPAAQPEPGLHFDRYAAFRSDLNKHAEAWHDRLAVPAEAREADNRAFVQLADDLGFDDDTLLTLHDHVVRGLTQAPSEADADDAAAAAAVQARDETVRQTLRQQLGEQRAADVIRRTEAFIERTPDLQQLVNSGALAANPEIRLVLAEHIQRHHIR